MATKKELVKLEGFRGINNVLKPENTPSEYLKEAVNVNIDKRGNIIKRSGYSLVSSGEFSSLWSNNSSCYAVKDGNLVEIRADYSATILMSGVDGNEIYFEEVNGIVFFTSKTINGIIENGIVRNWGMEIPTSAPLLSTVSGNLQSGTYQVSYSYVRDDGLESGTPVASMIAVPDSSGISFDIPSSAYPEVSMVRVYCSTHNGSELFYFGDFLLGASVVITTTAGLYSPLRMFNLYAAPLAECIAYYKARIYLVDKHIIWYSEPSQYEHFDINSGYLSLAEDVIDIMPVEDGIWIATEKNIYFASGTNPQSFNLTLKEKAVMVKGTGTKISSSYIEMEDGYKWVITTDIGIFVLSGQGFAKNMTSENISLERANKGASLFLQDNGMNQYLSMLEAENKPNNSVMGDIVTTTVIRNGITI